MITTENLGRSRRLYFRDGLTLSEIARKTEFARNTVKTWLRAAEGIEPKYRRRKGQTRIYSYAALLTKALEADARRLKRDRRSALKVYAEQKVARFPGDYSRVTEFVRRWRENGGESRRRALVKCVRFLSIAPVTSSRDLAVALDRKRTTVEISSYVLTSEVCPDRGHDREPVVTITNGGRYATAGGIVQICATSREGAPKERTRLCPCGALANHSDFATGLTPLSLLSTDVTCGNASDPRRITLSALPRTGT